MYRNGRSTAFIAKYLNNQGFASASGQPWTEKMVDYMLRMSGQPISQVHFRLIAEALGRGLSYREIANVLNRKKIHLLGHLPIWTARSVKKTWAKLNNPGEIGRRKISAIPAESAENPLKKSA